ncbi:MAG: FAD-binding oxidoreductase [Algoriphagus sp.]|uniref:FAD-binding oxidoreductase n=1 Tax=Algoriphagus sp. TaxID=1872435 RepID=UPI0027303677|nr:FAD-binding oxidoreductase [Algoriphagus sp.]MDP2042840.1 FAD-binding oxidoreductase [Algoriphagus sp.]MDP3471911.1 FAD-binding oxidoreductase [Algoriphagus sp.]
MPDFVKILDIQRLTHDVKQFSVEKPKGYKFVPGQATEVAIRKKDWEEEKRPFTFTSLPEDSQLEFVIKSYHDHDGVTKAIDDLKIGEELILEESWGAIEYKGKGTFIAGGAGVTPFIAILKDLQKKGELKGNQLIFANKTSKDVILEEWFRAILGDDFISILDQEEKSGHQNGRVDKAFLEQHISDFSQEFYICGPDPMIKAVSKSLEELGANPEAIVFEK